MNGEEFLEMLAERMPLEWPKPDSPSAQPIDYGWFFKDGAYVHQAHGAITIHDWNREKIKPNTKIRIESPEHSEYIESLIHRSPFVFGVTEPEEGNPYNYEYINFYSNNTACYGVDGDHKEINIEMPKENTQNKLKQEIIDSAPKGAERYSEEFEVYFKIEDDYYFYTCGKIREWKKVDGFELKTIEKDFMGATPLSSKHTSEASSEINAKVLAEKVSASDVLSQGAKHLSDRAVTYDSPEGERSMSATVEAFESITGHTLTEEQGWLFMAILKAVRSQQGEYKLDNYEDGAAYFALMAEAASGARK